MNARIAGVMLKVQFCATNEVKKMTKPMTKGQLFDLLRNLSDDTEIYIYKNMEAYREVEYQNLNRLLIDYEVDKKSCVNIILDEE